MGVSFATDKASHFMPWRPKFTCARASAPEPSSVTITPSPNLVWKTLWPDRRPWLGAFGTRAGALGTPRTSPAPTMELSPEPRAHADPRHAFGEREGVDELVAEQGSAGEPGH